MSDEITTTPKQRTVNSPKLRDLAYRTSFVSKQLRRVVWRNPDDDMYYVIERAGASYEEGWKVLSKGYRHSTSCYARLGRITHQHNIDQENQVQ